MSAELEASSSDRDHSPYPSPPKQKRRTSHQAADTVVVEDSESEASHPSLSKPRGSRPDSTDVDGNDRSSLDPPKRKRKMTVEQRVVYSIYYKGTLVLPGRGERGVALAGCVWVRVE